ncbi:MAG: MFS transporter [Ktedonobacteraceae bacterium]
MQLTKNIKLLSWFNFSYSFNLYYGIAIIYFVQVTHSYALGISILSITQVADALFEIPTGMYSDRIGRKTCIIVGSIAQVLAVVSYALGQLYVILIIGAVFEGLAVALYSGNNDALLYETVAASGDEQNYHDYYGKVTSMLSFSAAIAVVLGAIIAYWSFPLALWLSVIPQLLCVFIAFQFVEPPMRRKQSESIFTHIREALRYLVTNKKLRLLSIAGIIDTSVGGVSLRFRPAFYQTLWPVWAIGFARVIQYSGQAISFRASGKILNRFRAIKVLIFNTSVSKVIAILALLFPTVVSPVLLSSSGILYGPSAVASNTLLQREFTDRQRATIASINSFFGSIFFAIFGAIFGIFADRIGPAMSLLIAQLFLLPIILLYWLVFHAEKQHKPV